LSVQKIALIFNNDSQEIDASLTIIKNTAHHEWRIERHGQCDAFSATKKSYFLRFFIQLHYLCLSA